MWALASREPRESPVPGTVRVSIDCGMLQISDQWRLLDPEVGGRVSKSPRWSEIWILGRTMREQLYIKRAR